jgi:hypothetical protein
MTEDKQFLNEINTILDKGITAYRNDRAKNPHLNDAEFLHHFGQQMKTIPNPEQAMLTLAVALHRLATGTHADYETLKAAYTHTAADLDRGIAALREGFVAAMADGIAVEDFAATVIEISAADPLTAAVVSTAAMIRLATEECRHDGDWCGALHNVTTSYTCSEEVCGNGVKCGRVQP